ncbi:MAG: hypothetical protein KatS3mg027_2306 [Bacteroidia bacterium]|nr:MAG: hypothetical protein KatS3mg027_2306 [Bacteroidia bacterium]
MNKPQNILVLTYWDFNDALIQTYTLPYLRIIANHLSPHSKIYLVTLNKNSIPHSLQHDKIKILSFKYFPFSAYAIFYYSYVLLYLFLFIWMKQIKFIHVWCTPAGTFGYILSRLTFKPLIIDSYEPHAEAMVECNEWKPNTLPFKLLFYFEKKMTHHAQYLIATTEGMIKEYASVRFDFNSQKNNWFVKPACVDLSLFKPDEKERISLRKKLNLENKIIGIYAGKFGGIYWEDEFFVWLKTAQDFWKEKFHFILLSSHAKEYIQNKCQHFNINTHQLMHLFVPHMQVPQYLNIADFAISPIKPVYTKKFCSPIKDAEYWAMNLPVIIPQNISDDSTIVQKYNIGYALQDLSIEEFKKSIKWIDDYIVNQKNNTTSIRTIAEKYRNFSIAENVYKKIYTI